MNAFWMLSRAVLLLLCIGVGQEHGHYTGAAVFVALLILMEREA